MDGLYDILESYRDQQNRLNYEGLYQDPDRFLDYDNSRNDNSPMGNDYPFTGNIPTNRLARIDAIHYNRENLSSLPNNPYGVRSDYFDNFNPRIGLESQIPQNLEFLNNQNQATGIMQQAPLMNRFQGVSDMSLIDETTNDEQDENYIEQVEKSRNSLSGIMDLLRNIPTPFNLARRGLESLRGLNDRMQNSDFGRSKTLVDYLDARKYGGIDARDRKASQIMREARGIQTQVDRRGDSTSRVADRSRSSVTRSSAAKSKGVGGGGYTKSDSNRESYRG